MEDSRQADPKSAPIFRRRRAEIVSGITVVITVPLVSLAWTILRDLRENEAKHNTREEQRFEAAVDQCKGLIDVERLRAMEAEQDLKADIRELRATILTLGGRR